MADFRQRKEWFTASETDLLVREVKAREQQVYGSRRVPPKLPEVKQAWDEVAVSISSFSGITRSAAQCRKRYNDVRRRGKRKLAAHQSQHSLTGGGPPTTSEDLTPAEDIAASTLSAESIEGFGGVQVGVQAPLAEDPEAGPSTREQGVGPVVKGAETEEPAALRSTGETSRPRSQRGNTTQQEDHPFLELQQAGFHMLERELGAVRRSIGRINTRLCRMQVLLQPLARIADNLGRLADAVERLVPATPPPPTTRSPPSTRSVTRTLPPAAPGPSHGQPRRGATRL
ncbi:hypothetical protein SKAU_G00195610 [Synaphobranchus kaupii]|uniref:Myb/SANT-like DNA-binding domain-containing protein n=1 Tax=Synaphobranchus kaupii TaxID=118154 RepID=A0A9Q1IVM3_SYNKA|nr:hypothetical protein SKAU_G00195610 [Synaphobranchus kaupii]